MTNREKYRKVFATIFNINPEEVESLKYQGISAWDSVGHMELITELEDTFDIVMNTDDIVELSSYEKGMEILSNHYDIDFDLNKGA